MDQVDRSEGAVLYQVAQAVRKFSLVMFFVGLLAVFYTEAFADIPLGRDGKPKPPIEQQRLVYAFILAAGVPGAVWSGINLWRGDQKQIWE